MQLPLFSQPTTPSSEEDQIKFTNIFSAIEQYCPQETGHGDRSARVGEIGQLFPTSHAFRNPNKEELSESVRSPTLMLVSPQPSALDSAEDMSGELQDIPFLQDLSQEQLRIVPHQHDSSINFPAPSMRTRIFPESINSGGDDLNGRNSSESKGKPSSGGGNNVSSDATKNAADGLRFLIVVRWCLASE